jgi:hypothetical protein
MERLALRPEFEGAVQTGGRYVLVDDVTSLGGTIAELAHYIQRNGGIVQDVAVIGGGGLRDDLRLGQADVGAVEQDEAVEADERNYLEEPTSNRSNFRASPVTIIGKRPKLPQTDNRQFFPAVGFTPHRCWRLAATEGQANPVLAEITLSMSPFDNSGLLVSAMVCSMA